MKMPDCFNKVLKHKGKRRYTRRTKERKNPTSMDNSKTILLTETSLNDGYCFSDAAKLSAKESRIEPNDPRVHAAEENAVKILPRDLKEAKTEWRNVVSSGVLIESHDVTSILKSEKLLDESIVFLAKNLSFMLEKQALDILKRDGLSDRARSLIMLAARFCDTAVLHSRHLDEKNSVSLVSERTGIHPIFVLTGMIRIGLTDYTAPLVLAFIEGQYHEMNELNRAEFYKAAGAAQNISQTRELLNMSPAPDAAPWIAKSLVRIRGLRHFEGEPFEKEIEMMGASSEYAESLAFGWHSNDLEKAKTLAAVCLSAAARRDSIQNEHAHHFLRGEVHKRYRSCLSQ